MIHKKAIRKIAKDIFKFDKGIPNPKLMHPARDWQIGIIFGLVAFIAVSWWNFNTYLTYREDIVVEQLDSSGDDIVYREALVTATLESYDDMRETHQSFLQTNEAPPVVPEESPVEVDDEIDTSTSTIQTSIEEEEVVVNPPSDTEEITESTDQTEDEVIEIIGTPILE